MRLRFLLAVTIAAATSIGLAAAPQHQLRTRVEHRAQRFLATAYCKEGETQSGTTTHPGIVASDPHVLPTGSVVQISGVGETPKTYIVEDHGVKGRHVDLFVRSCRAAKQFGRKLILLRVLKVGDGQRLRSDGR